MTTAPHFIDVPPSEFNAIVDALYRFGAGQDVKDRELFESAFSEDAVPDFVQPAAQMGVTLEPFRGRQFIADAVMGSTAPLATSHTVANPRVSSYNGSRAELFALVEAQHLPLNDRSRSLMLKNVYVTDLTRLDAGWRIDHMKISAIWIEVDPTVLFPSVA